MLDLPLAMRALLLPSCGCLQLLSFVAQILLFVCELVFVVFAVYLPAIRI